MTSSNKGKRASISSSKDISADGETRPPKEEESDATDRIDLNQTLTDLEETKIDLGSIRSDLKFGIPTDPSKDTEEIDGTGSLAGPAKTKQKTARLAFSSAHPVSPTVENADSTTRIDTIQPKKSETKKIRLEEAHPVDNIDTDLPIPAAETQIVRPTDPSKSETYRIDLKKARSVPKSADGGADEKKPQQELEAISRAAYEENLKHNTMRVLLDENIQESGNVETVKITPHALSPTQQKSNPNQPMSGTTRITIDEEPSRNDVFKRRRRGPVDSPPPIARRSNPHKPGSTSTEPTRPPPLPLEELQKTKTIRIGDSEKGGKNQTARIELPPDTLPAHAGRPKMIKIKRIEHSAGRPTRDSAPAPASRYGTPVGEEIEIGPYYSLLAMISLLVMALLCYVLSAQTIAPSLAWIGKIGL